MFWADRGTSDAVPAWRSCIVEAEPLRSSSLRLGDTSVHPAISQKEEFAASVLMTRDASEQH